MRVWALLVPFDHTVAFMLLECRARAQFSVGAKGERGDVSAGIVGNKKIFSGFVEGNETRIGSAGGHLIEERQLSSSVVDSERADRAAFRAAEIPYFIDGVQIFFAGIHSQERRILRFGGNA